MGVSPKYFRSAQNIETVFAANCVGHQILVTILLSLLKKVAAEGPSSEARVVVTTSSMHSFYRQLDMDLLTAPTHQTQDHRWYMAVWSFEAGQYPLHEGAYPSA